MTLPTIKEFIINSLTGLYGGEEAEAIANTLLSHILNASVQKSFANITPSMLTADDVIRIEDAVKRLLMSEPLQYVLEEAWFYDLPFFVNKHVLIPRPETEELVDFILKSNPSLNQPTGISILDIGTGSGCIPIVLKSNLPQARVYAWDISEDALAVAKYNAQKLGTDITFMQVDILHSADIEIPKLDIIVSNPPYITETEKVDMHSNVLMHEPHLALFVSDGNPLQFYEVIVAFASKHLQKKGHLYVEINAAYGNEVKACMENHGFSQVTIIKDMQGKNRFVSGTLV